MFRIIAAMPTADEQRQIRVIARGLTGFTERAVVKLTLDVTKEIVVSTGADTGWLRASFVPSVGAPYEGTEGDRPASGETVTTSAARAAGEARVLGYKLAQGSAFVVNNVPYAALRNERGFTQARNSRGEIEGPGFVQRAIADAVRAAESLRP